MFVSALFFSYLFFALPTFVYEQKLLDLANIMYICFVMAKKWNMKSTVNSFSPFSFFLP